MSLTVSDIGAYGNSTDNDNRTTTFATSDVLEIINDLVGRMHPEH